MEHGHHILAGVSWSYSGRLMKHGHYVCVSTPVLPNQINNCVSDHLQAAEIRHFVYKSRKTSCVTSPKVPIVYRDKEDRDR